MAALLLLLCLAGCHSQDVETPAPVRVTVAPTRTAPQPTAVAPAASESAPVPYHKPIYEEVPPVLAGRPNQHTTRRTRIVLSEPRKTLSEPTAEPGTNPTGETDEQVAVRIRNRGSDQPTYYEIRALAFANQTASEIRSATTMQQVQDISDRMTGIVLRSEQESGISAPRGIRMWATLADFLRQACEHQSELLAGTSPAADQYVDASIYQARVTSRYCDAPMP